MRLRWGDLNRGLVAAARLCAYRTLTRAAALPAAFPPATIANVRTHQDIDRRSLEMIRRIVARIDADPQRHGFEHAKRVCDRWVAQGIGSAREWQRLLQKPWEDVRAILLDESDEGQRLRQTDPFCGILTPAERWEIYRKARSAGRLDAGEDSSPSPSHR